MPDFRIADTAPEHVKLRAAGAAAVGVWAMAGAFAMRELTDGWVPAYWVRTWDPNLSQAARLVDVGLWRPERVGKIDGYRFHDWTTIQRTKAEIEEDRRKARDRMREIRSRSVRPNVRGTKGARSRNVHDSLPLPQGGGTSVVPSPTETPARDVDPDVARRGMALVRDALADTPRKRALRSPQSAEEHSAGPSPAARPDRPADAERGSA